MTGNLIYWCPVIVAGLLSVERRLFLLFVMKFGEIPFLREVGKDFQAEKPLPGPLALTEDDDIDLCLYYLRTLYHVLIHTGETSGAILVSKHLSFGDVAQVQISSMCSLTPMHIPISLLITYL